MKMIDFYSDETGFTIQELLVVLLVSSLLLSMSLSVFFFTNKLIFSWKQRSEVSLSTHRIMNRVALDCARAIDLEQLSDSTLVLREEGGRVTQYRFRFGRVWRNDVNVESLGLISYDVRAKRLESTMPGDENIAIEVSGRMRDVFSTANAILRIQTSNCIQFDHELAQDAP